MLILVIGGARSGKSAAAEALASRLPAPVTYVATIIPDEQDANLMQRIEAHRRRRPESWTTLEAERGLPEQLRAVVGTVLLDSLGPWIAGHDPSAAELESLIDALRTRDGDTVVVSEEVGMSVHPSSEAGRLFPTVALDADALLNGRPR